MGYKSIDNSEYSTNRRECVDSSSQPIQTRQHLTKLAVNGLFNALHLSCTVDYIWPICVNGFVHSIRASIAVML